MANPISWHPSKGFCLCVYVGCRCLRVWGYALSCTPQALFIPVFMRHFLSFSTLLAYDNQANQGGDATWSLHREVVQSCGEESRSLGLGLVGSWCHGALSGLFPWGSRLGGMVVEFGATVDTSKSQNLMLIAKPTKGMAKNTQKRFLVTDIILIHMFT